MRFFYFFIFLAILLAGCSAENNAPDFTYSANYNVLQDVYFTDTLNGWVVGTKTYINNGNIRYGEIILHTNDNGNIWTEQLFESSTKGGLNSVTFRDESNGWAAGDSGRILFTNNGGKSWILQNTGIKNRLNSIHFIDELNGWAAGQAGTILKTSDGGQTWSVVYTSSDYDFTDIYFSDQNTGIACGYKYSGSDTGFIAVSNNGGTSWTFPVIPSPAPGLNRIFFVGNDSGWAAGQNYIIRTKDAGKNWTLQWTPVKGYEISSIDALHFKNSMEGFAGGYFGEYAGRIIRTNNGGENWFVSASHLEIPLEIHSIFFSGQTHGWAVGGLNARIFHTTDGGDFWFREY